MAVKLFVLGSPGSGKSTLCRHIIQYLRLQYADMPTWHINDYDILYQMFRDYKDDSEQKRIVATHHDGFVVLDPTIYNDALKNVEREIGTLVSEQMKFIAVEFARRDYQEAFRQFSRSLIEDAHFLFLDVTYEHYAQRVHKRVAHPTTHDDHFVSDFILEAYSYRDTDSKQYILSHFAEEYGLERERIKVLENNGTFEDIVGTINQFIKTILT